MTTRIASLGTKNRARPSVAIAACALVVSGWVIAAPFSAARASADLSAFTDYPLPPSSTNASGITAGPDGNLWFGAGLSSPAHHIDRMSTSGAITSFPLPTPFAGPEGIVTGPDSNLWFAEYDVSQIGRITTSGQVTEYPTPTPDSGPLEITVGSDGALWFAETQADTGPDHIGRITTSGQITEFAVPSTSVLIGSITTGPDGNVWFTEVGKIGMMTPTGVLTEYSMPTGRDCCNEITAGPDGNLWFTGLDNGGNGEIGKLTTSGDVTEYPLNYAGANPYHIISGPDGALWFMDEGTANLGRIDVSGNVTEYALPVSTNSSLGVNFLGIGPDGAIWCPGVNEIERVSITTLLGSPGPTYLSAPSPTEVPSLSWTGVPGATSYNVYRNVYQGVGGDALIANTANTTYLDTSAPSNSDMSYYVTAVTTSGETSPSNRLIMITLPPAVPPVFTSVNSLTIGMRWPIGFEVTTTGSPAPSITYTGTLPPGVTLVDEGGGTADFVGMAPAGSAGVYVITISASNGTTANPVQQTFTLTVTTAPSAPAIISNYYDVESFGVPFAFTVQTLGYPVPTIKKSGTLPNGVRFTDNGDGTATIGGMATGAASGVYSLTLTAKNSAGVATLGFSLTITKAPVFNAVSGKALTAVAGTAYSVTVTTSAYGPANITELGSLPAGLTFNNDLGNTAVISGTPTSGSGGAYSITLTASNPFGTVSQSFTLKVDEVPSITSNNTATAVSLSTFTFQVTALGYPMPKYTVTGALPAGVKFSASGAFSGKPKAGTAGSYPLMITATNSQGVTTQAFDLIVD